MAAIYTYADIQNQVLANLDETGTTGTTLTVVQNFLNAAQIARLASQPWSFMLWDQPETLTTTASDRFYALHPEFWRPHYFFNRTTKDYLIEVPPRGLAETGVRWNETSEQSAQYFRFAGRLPVETQPAATGTVSIVSTSASDNTSAKAITIVGVTANGVTSESITPNGTTPVTSTNSYSKILNVTKAAAWAGNLSLKDSSSNTMLFLFPTEYGRSYQQMELLAAPKGSEVIEYRFYRQPRKMTADNDIPDIPPPHSQILVWDALVMFAGYNTEISPAAIAMWKGNADRMERDMSTPSPAFIANRCRSSLMLFVSSPEV
jgi:hypothetical protein